MKMQASKDSPEPAKLKKAMQSLKNSTENGEFMV
jgi:hypothetical protein